MESQPQDIPKHLFHHGKYELIDTAKAQEDPYYWLGEMQPQFDVPAEVLEPAEIRQLVANTVNADVSEEKLSVALKIVELIPKTDYLWRLEELNTTYEVGMNLAHIPAEPERDSRNKPKWNGSYAVPEQELINDEQKEHLQSEIKLGALTLAAARLENNTVVIGDVPLVLRAWDNTDRDPQVQDALIQMIDNLKDDPLDQERYRSRLSESMTTGMRYIDVVRLELAEKYNSLPTDSPEGRSALAQTWDKLTPEQKELSPRHVAA